MKWHDSLETIYALLFAICILIALLLLAGCERKAAEAPEARPTINGQSIVFPAGSAAAQRLAVERVEPPRERDLAIPGRLTWNEERTVRVFTPFAGRVTRIIANVGDRVAAGAPLAEILSPDFGQAQADARKAQADLALARQTLERQRELNAAGIVARKDLQQAEADHARAQAENDRAQARLTSYGRTAGAEPHFVLRSPMAGTVVERNLNPGQELRPDQPGAPLFVVTDPTRLWVVLDASEADLRYLAAGMQLVIKSTQFPEDAFAGTLTKLADFVDPTSRTVKLRGDVPNSERTLKAEMFVTGNLKIPAGDAPTVNSRAVYLEGARRFAFVRANPTTFVRRPVRVGSEAGGRVAVLSGLQVGDEVVTSSNLFLQQMLSQTPPEEKSAKLP